MEITYRLTELFIELMRVMAWPLFCLITVVILKDSLRDLIKRIRRIGNDSVGIDASANNEQSTTTNENPLNILSRKSSNDSIEKALGFFNEDTLNFFKEFINRETQLESIISSEDKVSTLYRYSQILYLFIHFNRAYNQIFGSQLSLLHALCGSPNETKDSLKIFYTNAKSQNPKFFDHYSYEQYLEFLVTNHLIKVVNANTIQITPIGRDFLKFIIETGLSADKLN